MKGNVWNMLAIRQSALFGILAGEKTLSGLRV